MGAHVVALLHDGSDRSSSERVNTVSNEMDGTRVGGGGRGGGAIGREGEVREKKEEVTAGPLGTLGTVGNTSR